MIVVSDTTPLRYLAVIGHLELLPRLFGLVHCPDVVIAECLHPSAPAVLRAWAGTPPEWLRIQEVASLDSEFTDLDDGEAAALTLARQLHAEAVLIDENKARKLAASMGFVVAGTLTILAQSGIRGWIDYHAVTRLLRDSTNFRITDEVVQAVWDDVRRAQK